MPCKSIYPCQMLRKLRHFLYFDMNNNVSSRFIILSANVCSSYFIVWICIQYLKIDHEVNFTVCDTNPMHFILPKRTSLGYWGISILKWLYVSFITISLIWIWLKLCQGTMERILLTLTKSHLSTFLFLYPELVFAIWRMIVSYVVWFCNVT